MAEKPDIPAVLSIAGSDSGGGAGIQADLKAFAHCGVHGMTAITAITAQNTTEVTAVEPVPPQMIVAQVRAVAEDIGVDAVKIGMLGSRETIAAVGEALDLIGEVPIVLDPVMVAESGAMLLDENARTALSAELIPRVTVVTPNMAEARVLAGIAGVEGSDPDSQEDLARAILALGPGAVVVTGGHTASGGDLLIERSGTRSEIRTHGPFAHGAGHGSGCTHSSVLAARLALGDDIRAAAFHAHELAATAVSQGLRGVGHGTGPVDVIGLADRRDHRRWA